MNWFGRLAALGCLGFVVGPAAAQYGQSYTCPPQQYLPPGCAMPAMPGTTTPGTTTPGTTTPGTTTPGTTTPGTTTPGTTTPGETGNQSDTNQGDAFARAGEGGTQPAASFNPAMFGDLIGIQARKVIVIPHGVTPGMYAKLGIVGVSGNTASVVAPVPSRAAFKVTENESPMPTDRVYLSYDYYNNVDRQIPGAAEADYHRETLGFEKTFLNGDASIGMRLPFQQLVGDSQIDDYSVGDLDLLFKFALINDRTTGDVLSTGMVVTLPTGQNVQFSDGESALHSTIFQPFVGYIFNFSDVFVQGFSSVAVPTDMRDVSLLFNSVGVGYWLYRDNSRDAMVRGIIPTAELHLNTPLNHRGLDAADPIGYPDSLDGTFGAHIVFQRSVLGFAVGAPLMGPRPYDVEAEVNFQFQW